MIISHKYRFIYFAPPKTATTTLKHVLVKYFEASVLGVNRHETFIPKDYEDYFIFTSVRNPYDRAISGYNYQINRTQEKKPVFDFLLDKPIMPSLYDSIFNASSPVPMRLDAFVKCEQLQADFDALPFVNRKINLPILNISPKERCSYGCFGYNYVRKHYQKDFEYFGYDIDRFPIHFKLML